jgi:thioredoxin 1
MDRSHGEIPTAEVGEATFEAEVLKVSLPVLVAFYAPWSRPCQVLEATLEEVAKACVGRVKVVKVNADDNPDLSLWYEVQSIPTLLFFADGSVRAAVVGTATKEAILSKIERAFPSPDCGCATPHLPSDDAHGRP